MQNKTPKDFEKDVLAALSSIDGIPMKSEQTGVQSGIDKEGKDCYPDIVGTYKGHINFFFVVDTKLYKESYIRDRDVKKLVRDAEANSKYSTQHYALLYT